MSTLQSTYYYLGVCPWWVQSRSPPPPPPPSTPPRPPPRPPWTPPWTPPRPRTPQWSQQISSHCPLASSQSWAIFQPTSRHSRKKFVLAANLGSSHSFPINISSFFFWGGDTFSSQFLLLKVLSISDYAWKPQISTILTIPSITDFLHLEELLLIFEMTNFRNIAVNVIL